MTRDRDCRHGTGDDQRLQTLYKRWSETADMIQEMVGVCGHDIEDDQKLQTHGTRDGQRLWRDYRRWLKAVERIHE
ncbi:unnamed protein product, partial [Staurois parvus]